MFKRIVVPLDGSRAAEAVLPYVERLTTATSAHVLLLAAVDKPRDWGEDTGGDLKGERHEAESYLRALQARLASATGRAVECEVASAEPVSAILDASGRQQADLIAMTTHGRSGVFRWVLGSVAAKLLHATDLPLLLVRPSAEGKPATPALRKILVPLDGSKLSESAVPLAAELAKLLEASIVLFHGVVEPVLTYPAGGAVLDDGTWKRIESGANDYLMTIVNDLAAKGVDAEPVVTMGNATDGIVWAADRENAGLIAMSSHGRSGVGRLVLGSVADAVVRRTSLPVIVIRPAKEGDANR